MQTAPSTSTPSVKINPPSITRNSATAIAGIAVIARALRSERCLDAAERRPARAPARRLRSSLSRIGRERRVPGGRCAPPAISPRSPPTEATPTLGILRERLLERCAGEVRPQLIAEDQ